MEDVTTLGDDMGKVQPTFLIAVPRVFNKIYAGLWAKMNEKGGWPKNCLKWELSPLKKGANYQKMASRIFSPILNSRLQTRLCLKKFGPGSEAD
jgi:long-subunit acyl-CoA synthetase (AMP-forming)